jgi:hypothetical protein
VERSSLLLSLHQLSGEKPAVDAVRLKKAGQHTDSE